MAPGNKDGKEKKKRKPIEQDCTKLAQAQVFVQDDENAFGYNWVEILCYPYILCGRIWECCVGVFANANVCLLCWLILQWIMCKIAKLSPDPVLFPYYFYIFCQVTILSAVLLSVWFFVWKPVIFPYLLTVYDAFVDKKNAIKKGRRMALRRFCFKKSEILGTSVENAAPRQILNTCTQFICGALYVFIYNVFE